LLKTSGYHVVVGDLTVVQVDHDQPMVKSSGVSCHQLKSAPRASVASPSVNAHSSQLTSTQGSDHTYQPSQSDESLCDDADDWFVSCYYRSVFTGYIL